MSQTHRKDGGLIDQDKTITFTFNGQILRGCEGDTSGICATCQQQTPGR